MKLIPQRLQLGLIAFAILGLWSPHSEAKTVTLTFSTDNTNYTVSFDTSRISESQMRELVLLSPLVTDYAGVPHPEGFWIGASTKGAVRDKRLLAVPLENCSKDDAAYTSCQASDISSPNFLHNAEVNLGKARRGLAWLQHLDHPKELQPVIDYLLHGLEVSVWMDEIQFRYYTTWDERVLKEAHEGIDSFRLCPDVFKKLETTSSKEEKYRIVRFDWASCMVGAASRRLGSYPTESWKSFLQTYGIKEHYMEKGPD
jgi:hypothetical protein